MLDIRYILGQSALGLNRLAVLAAIVASLTRRGAAEHILAGARSCSPGNQTIPAGTPLRYKNVCWCCIDRWLIIEHHHCFLCLLRSNNLPWRCTIR